MVFAPYIHGDISRRRRIAELQRASLVAMAGSASQPPRRKHIDTYAHISNSLSHTQTHTLSTMGKTGPCFVYVRRGGGDLM